MLPVVAAGAVSITVSGAVASMVQVWLAAVASVFAAPSVARTSKVWLPSRGPAYVFGFVQELELPPSSRHSNVRLPGAVTSSVPENVKVAAVRLVRLVGPLSTVVCGAVLSVMLNDCGTSAAAA